MKRLDLISSILDKIVAIGDEPNEALSAMVLRPKKISSHHKGNNMTPPFKGVQGKPLSKERE